MAEILGDAIHGGEVIVREKSDSMYQYLDRTVREKREVSLVEQAYRAFPWAPKKGVEAVNEHADAGAFFLTVRLAVLDHVRAAACEVRIKDAEQAKCACGSPGSWDESISGSSGNQSCVWAGCPNCRGTAVGRPILTTDLMWYERYAKKKVAS